MRSIRILLLSFSFLTLFVFSCTKKTTELETKKETKETIVEDSYDVKEYYNKQEVDIVMRDGTKLHTTIYSPKDTSKKYPILMNRTPYSSRPYGVNQFRSKIGPNEFLMKEGNIIVYQDVRGRWMSEGVYDNMRAYIPNKTEKQFDEASDTYDTIDWLVKNVENNNGNVGVWGISYPGFYATYSLLDSHPALKAVSPQACIGDFFFDDFHHNGAYLLSYWRATAVFGYEKTEPVSESWYTFPELGSKDQYQFFLDVGPLSNLDQYYKEDNVFWTQLKEHPNYDEFWQSRGIIQHLKDIKPAVMTVGGLFDAEDLYGPFETYENIENKSNNYNIMVFGPWSHGDWARTKKRQAIGNVYFGDDISLNFQKNVETKFFNHFLKGEGDETGLPEIQIFDTGKKEWNSYENWPPKNIQKKTFYLSANEELSEKAGTGTSEFISDPKKPVPYSEDIKMVFTPRKYMTDDQRFAARRPDVLVFETPVLTEDVTLSGEILAKLKVATTGTDADWAVKLIDVYPNDIEDTEETQKYLKMANYHMMVRSEVMRGRFRNSFSNPEPFIANQKTDVNIKLQDVHHTFKKGHKIHIQVQSTWFPLIDLNPQTYVPNIFKAEASDFTKQTHKVYHDSAIEVSVLK
ncbi:CocE/NonD family hydrolase [Aquimarina sp. MMG016]|uniref:CocE/NonD family hydrolase n=1 Tax=Aquimarina sp. MMG016 TaxID=2822690 RepID=UPI001B3A3342|nr:CocE/NonD family hydrolase [Aquimarina sp. MMG016]MBQ4821105.1 CocE/NonD family hydrolase [Aquimarina sp. MMG016]